MLEQNLAILERSLEDNIAIFESNYSERIRQLGSSFAPRVPVGPGSKKLIRDRPLLNIKMALGCNDAGILFLRIKHRSLPLCIKGYP